MEAKRTDASYLSTAWTFEVLRKQWNQEKMDVFPWWRDSSKEAYSSGIADLLQAPFSWPSSKHGRPKGRKVGFPKFKSKRKDQNQVCFTTGTMRFEDDHRTIVLPGISALGSKENTRRVQRHLAKDNACIIKCTLSERWGRLFVSCQLAVRNQVVSPTARTPSNRDARVGVDLGMRSPSTIADANDNMQLFSNPIPLLATLTERRRVGRSFSRRIPGSREHLRGQVKLSQLERRCVYIRRKSIHQLTRYLVDNDSDVKIGGLDLAAMKRSMRKRAFRRSVSDAGLGAFRPPLACKADRSGVKVVPVDRFFGSSQIDHGHGERFTDAKLAWRFTCVMCGTEVIRDENAAVNIRDWSVISPGLV